MLTVINISPEHEALLARLARDKGRRDADELAQEVLASYLKHEEEFIEQAKKGFDSLDRGEFVEDDEVVKRIARLFEP
jgi:predicted transcriptional regulator